MATVVQSIIEPDVDAIKTHLALLFAPCVEHYPQGLIELRYGSPKPNQSAYFPIHTKGLTEAAQFAADRNRQGMNIYVGVNPRRPETKGTAVDTDVRVAFFQFADLDDIEAVENAGRRLKALPPIMTVTTGTEPHRRPHFYWQLEEPVGNMPAWTERQRGIAHSLDGDSVINPSRIMRLAGTVNFPPQDKLAKGYRVELTSIKTQFDDERAPVTPEQIATAYPVRSGHVESAAMPLNGETTLAAMRATQIGDLLEACRSDNQWHNSMIRLVAHLAAKGRASAEILAMAESITLPGYTPDHTRREMLTALQSARAKWDLPEPQDEPVEREEETREEADAIFETLSLDQIENLPPPTYLVDGLVPEHGITFIYGDPAAGKTFIALDLSLRLAFGMDWHGTPTRPTGVLYIAGEGRHGIGKRVKGWRHEHGLEGADAPFKLLPVPVHLLDPKNREKLKRTIVAVAAEIGFKIGLVVIDTVSRAIPGHDENKQDVMSLFIDGCTDIHNFMDGATLGVHHSGKDSERGMRGSSVLLGGCDATIKVTKTEERVALETEKQKDDEEAAPIYMTMKKVSWATGLEEEQSTLVPFRSEAPVKILDTLSNEQIARAFGILADAWGAGRPLSTSPNTREQGRYAPSVLAGRIGCTEAVIKTFLVSWLETDCLAIEEVDSHSKTKGIRVLNPIVKGG